MKRVIKFSRFRVIMLVLSGFLILSGLAGLYIRGGLNLGIDFKGGLTEQIQIIPVAFTIEYTGVGNAELGISGEGILSLIVPQAGLDEPERLTFDFQTYRTIGVLTDLLSRIDNIEITVFSDPNASTERIYPIETPVSITGIPASINALLAEGDDIYASIAQVRETLADLEKFTIQVVGSPINQEFIIRVEVDTDDRDFQEKMESRVLSLMGGAFGPESIILKKSDFVGPRFSQDLVEQSISLTTVALALILIYISIRFRFIYAVAAILALVHDVAIMIGVIGAFQLEITTTTIAAVLTIVGYSLNDTIVIFDRIRENATLLRDSELEIIINTSITQSLSRTLITSFTTLLAVVAIFIFGTGEIQTFALALIIGVVIGTYSSIFIASPTILGWQMALERKKRAKETQKYGVKKVEDTPAKTEPAKTAVAKTPSDGNTDQPELQEKTQEKAAQPPVKKTVENVKLRTPERPGQDRGKRSKRKKKRKKR